MSVSDFTKTINLDSRRDFYRRMYCTYPYLPPTLGMYLPTKVPGVSVSSPSRLVTESVGRVTSGIVLGRRSLCLDVAKILGYQPLKLVFHKNASGN